MALVQFQFILKIGLEGHPRGTQIMQLMLSFGNLVLNTRLFFCFFSVPRFSVIETLRFCLLYYYEDFYRLTLCQPLCLTHLRVIGRQQILWEAFEKVDLFAQKDDQYNGC